MCVVQKKDEVNKAFEFVRLHTMDARHIISACKLPGTNVVNSEECYDSEEHRAGSKLLKYMNAAEL